jgi:hypothetical protein
MEELRTEIWALKAPRYAFASLIVADFLALFAEFRRKRFSLLWRGSRNGFRAHHSHRRCDGHAPTLVLIEDMEGSIFGGFTPVKWESSRDYKARSDRHNREHRPSDSTDVALSAE